MFRSFFNQLFLFVWVSFFHSFLSIIFSLISLFSFKNFSYPFFASFYYLSFAGIYTYCFFNHSYYCPPSIQCFFICCPSVSLQYFYSIPGMPNASIPTPEPVKQRKMFGAYGKSIGQHSVAFVSQVCIY